MGYGNVAFATYQSADKLIYNNSEYSLYSNPLEMYFKSKNIKEHKFNCKAYMVIFETCIERSSNWRGYIASWVIEDDVLYLKKIKNLSRESINLAEMFGNKYKHKKVEARWYSGKLKISNGALLKSISMGYGSIYEEDIFLEIKFGKVTGKRVVDNTKKPLPTDNTLFNSEASKAIEIGTLKK